MKVQTNSLHGLSVLYLWAFHPVETVDFNKRDAGVLTLKDVLALLSFTKTNEDVAKKTKSKH